MHKPLILIAPGDPSGIGPEVTLRALGEHGIHAVCRPVVLCDPAVLMDTRLGLPLPDLAIASGPGGIETQAGTVTVLPGALLPLNAFSPGNTSAASAAAAVAWVSDAARHTLAGSADALVTGPLNKEAMRSAGVSFIGHTELLASIAGVDSCTTMLATPGLRVTHVTRHLRFRDIADALSTASIVETIELTHKGLQQMGIANPRLAVAGLNPHNGDKGLLGTEEAEIIAPAVEKGRASGMDVYGPVPADSVFFQAIEGRYDAVVCLYHDQGHIAVKTHDFPRSITITLGLPFIRTSVDHGTAFDIAGKAEADPASMIEAIKQAVVFAAARAQH